MMISPSESRIINHTYSFAPIIDKEDLKQVARLAAWRATRSFDPCYGSSLKSYRTSAVRNAVYGEACRFHRVFTLKQRDDRSEITSVQMSELGSDCSGQGPDSTKAIIDQLSKYINIEKWSPLEWAIVYERFLGTTSADVLIARFSVSRAQYYRTEKQLKERIEKEIMHA